METPGTSASPEAVHVKGAEPTKANKTPVPASQTLPPAPTTTVSILGGYVDLVSKLVGLLTWPVLALIALAIFHTPLSRMADLLPDKFERSNEFGIGILSIKIQEQARAAGNEELAKIISGLSQDSIEWLLKIGDGSHRVISTDDGRDGITRNFRLPATTNKAWRKLEEKGLLKANIPLPAFEEFFISLKPQDEAVPKSGVSAKDEEKLLSNSVRLTESGQRAYRIIISVVSDMIGNRSPSKQTNTEAK